MLGADGVSAAQRLAISIAPKAFYITATSLLIRGEILIRELLDCASSNEYAWT